MSLNQLGGDVVKSIQTGTITVSATSQTATITSVDTAKAIVLPGGHSESDGAAALRGSFSRVVLTNATTVTATRGTDVAADGIVAYTVLEFN